MTCHKLSSLVLRIDLNNSKNSFIVQVCIAKKDLFVYCNNCFVERCLWTKQCLLFFHHVLPKPFSFCPASCIHWPIMKVFFLSNTEPKLTSNIPECENPIWESPSRGWQPSWDEFIVFIIIRVGRCALISYYIQKSFFLLSESISNKSHG